MGWFSDLFKFSNSDSLSSSLTTVSDSALEKEPDKSRVDRAIEALMAHVTISPWSPPTVLNIGSDSPLMRAAKLFGELHSEYPNNSDP